MTRGAVQLAVSFRCTADRTYQKFVRGLTDATASPGIG